MKEIRIKIYGWSDLKKWLSDRLCFSKRKLITESLEIHNDAIRRLTIGLLLKYNNKDIKNDYDIFSEAIKYWNSESKKICDETVKQIMMK